MAPTARPISEGTDPATPSVIMAGSGQTVSLGEMDSRSRRLAGLWRDRGLHEGDHVAVLLDNHPRYFEVCWAAQRAGLYCTPINWHLGPDEAGYILTDCEARALVTTARMSGVVTALADRLAPLSARLALDGPLEGFEDYEQALPGPDRDDGWADGRQGVFMFYSSGTTGRPKGIQPPLRDTPFGADTPLDLVVRGLFQFRPGMVYLCPAPLYHAAPIAWSMAAQRVGGSVVVMERFEPEATLDAIARYRITHAQFVPTHFVRMLKLPATTKARYDLSSLEMVVHAAAPCPVDVKRQMLEWFGPIIHEYYSGSEGMGFCAVGPEEWLRRPGTVGRSLGGPVHVTGEDGEELPPGAVGQVWFEATNRFEYHNDPEKTASVFNPKGWGTLGDVGYVDAEGYLFLTDRVSHMIISGGVNIYPQEIEDVLVVHPQVADAGVIGVPDEEMGESVLAVVQPAAPDVDTAQLEEDLRELCRARLAGYKGPRSYRFVPELPRLPTGKLLKRKLREEFGGSSAATVIGSQPGGGHGNS